MNPKIIRRSLLAQKLGISLPTLWRLEKAGKLPAKIKISTRAVGWRSDDIEQWISSNQSALNNESHE